MANLKGKKILLTGAASGIGLCAAREFAREGCELILTDLNAEALKKAADEIRGLGATVHTYCYDISDKAAVDDMAANVIKKLGGINVLINNAGIGHSGEMVETSIETWKRLMDINFWGTLNHVYAFLPWMIENKTGHIVTVSSGQAFFRLPTWGPYATVKLALGAFSEILRFEVRKLGIKVTTVYPFMVNTPFYKDIKGETFGEKLSMKLVPYYSMKPETVGRILFDAVKKQKAVEMVSILNDMGFLSRAIPPLGNLVSLVTIGFMGKSAEELRKQFSGK